MEGCGKAIKIVDLVDESAWVEITLTIGITFGYGPLAERPRPRSMTLRHWKMRLDNGVGGVRGK
eukprot:346083-Amorphochlora_amoeboformis.AAC.1